MGRRALRHPRFGGLLALVCAALATGAGASAQERGERPRRLENPDADSDVVEAAKALRRASRSEALPAVGDPAPDFLLALLPGSNPPDHVRPDAEGRVRLSGHRGSRPVVLIFGSYT